MRVLKIFLLLTIVQSLYSEQKYLKVSILKDKLKSSRTIDYEKLQKEYFKIKKNDERIVQKNLLNTLQDIHKKVKTEKIPKASTNINDLIQKIDSAKEKLENMKSGYLLVWQKNNLRNNPGFIPKLYAGIILVKSLDYNVILVDNEIGLQSISLAGWIKYLLKNNYLISLYEPKKYYDEYSLIYTAKVFYDNKSKICYDNADLNDYVVDINSYLKSKRYISNSEFIDKVYSVAFSDNFRNADETNPFNNKISDISNILNTGYFKMILDNAAEY